jgi:hypothetical protein
VCYQECAQPGWLVHYVSFIYDQLHNPARTFQLGGLVLTGRLRKISRQAAVDQDSEDKTGVLALSY